MWQTVCARRFSQKDRQITNPCSRESWWVSVPTVVRSRPSLRPILCILLKQIAMELFFFVLGPKCSPEKVDCEGGAVPYPDTTGLLRGLNAACECFATSELASQLDTVCTVGSTLSTRPGVKYQALHPVLSESKSHLS